MKRTSYFAKPEGFVTCHVGRRDMIRLPVAQGILKHPDGAELRRLLRERPQVAEKYTREALKHAAWPILRFFPRSWLLKFLKSTELSSSRRMALKYLLS
jgi:hypothetical protein